MKLKQPPNLDWFLPSLGKLEFFKGLNWKELFQYSTEEILKKYERESKDGLINLVLAERFIIENIENNIYSKKFLEFVLEDHEVRGNLIELPEEVIYKDLENFNFIRLEEDKFFYPLEWGNIGKLLITLWKKGKSFWMIEVVLKNKQDLEKIENWLKLSKILNFSYLSQKTLKILQKYLPTLDLKILEDLNSKFLIGSLEVLALVDFNHEITKDAENFIDNSQRFIKSKDKILFLGKTYQEIEVIEKFSKLSAKIGVLTKDLWEKYKAEEATPLNYLIGALEHAKRLNNENIIMFEGFTYHVIGDLYYEWGDLYKALKYYSLAKEYTKQPVELALSESAIYYTLGDLDKAEKILKAQLCGCLKEDPMVHHNIGLIYFKKGKTEKAKFHFYKAYLLDPENHVFRESLMKFLWDIEAYEELEELLNSVKNLTDKEEIFLGKLAFYKKDYKKAFEYLKKIFTYPDKDGETLLFLAWLYLYFNKEKEVSEILLKEAKGVLNKKEFDKIAKELGLNLK